jgi:ubiquinone biosynthesis protein COQ9
LGAILGATVLYWLEDRSEDFVETRAFIDRRLAGMARIGRARRDLETLAERLPNPLRLFRPLR